jgi:glycosyltransferase involved in cell wall biosynthesis
VKPDLRVLHIAAGNLYGGVESQLVTLAWHRDAAPDVGQQFACCYDGRLAKELRARGAAVHLLGEARLSRPWSVWRVRVRLRRLIRQDGINAVICHSAWPQAVFGPAARAEGAALVFWLHGACDGRHWLERWARRTVPDVAVCNSRFTTESLAGLYPGVRAEVLHCPVAPAERLTAEQRLEVRRELGTPADAVVLLQASRMEPLKGHGLLLQALGRLRDEPRWVLWLAGGAQRPEEEAYVESLRAQAASEGITDRVRFLGQRDDVPRLMAAADVYCQANTRPEGFGISFVEALGAGLPAVTTDLGGAREVVDATCGVLVPPGSAESFAAALAGLIADPARRARLGAAGPARARQLCDPATHVRRLAELLVDVAGGKGACATGGVGAFRPHSI